MCSATREATVHFDWNNPRLPQLEKSMNNNKDPAQPKKKKRNYPAQYINGTTVEKLWCTVNQSTVSALKFQLRFIVPGVCLTSSTAEIHNEGIQRRGGKGSDYVLSPESKASTHFPRLLHSCTLETSHKQIL